MYGRMKKLALHGGHRCALALLAAFICASSALADTPQEAPAPEEQSAPGSTAAPGAAVPSIDHADLAAVNDKLNDIKTLKASFTQIDSKGTATGQFYLSRPGGLRFEYDPPRKLLVIANDHTVIVQESANIAPYRASIDQTPLRLLLKPNIDLARDANIIDAHREGGLLYVTAVETKGYGQGQVTFIFSEPSLDLRRWVVVDPMGAQTIVTLHDVQLDASLDKKLFKLPPPPKTTGFGPIR